MQRYGGVADLVLSSSPAGKRHNHVSHTLIVRRETCRENYFSLAFVLYALDLGARFSAMSHVNDAYDVGQSKVSAQDTTLKHALTGEVPAA